MDGSRILTGTISAGVGSISSTGFPSIDSQMAHYIDAHHHNAPPTLILTIITGSIHQGALYEAVECRYNGAGEEHPISNGCPSERPEE